MQKGDKGRGDSKDQSHSALTSQGMSRRLELWTKKGQNGQAAEEREDLESRPNIKKDIWTLPGV